MSLEQLTQIYMIYLNLMLEMVRKSLINLYLILYNFQYMNHKGVEEKYPTSAFN